LFNKSVAAALAYDQKKRIEPDAIIKGCLQFLSWIATESTQEYFDDSANPQACIDSASAYFHELLKQWSRWPELEKEGRNAEIIELISSIVHTTESNNPLTASDQQRLGPLALQIDCWLPTMRGAFTELSGS